MIRKLEPTVREYLHHEVMKRFVRIEVIAAELGLDIDETKVVAKAADALYVLPKIVLVNRERLDVLMKHIYKIPGNNKYVIKKFARIGEGSKIYSIGTHRFIELARDAGATYKVNKGSGGMVLVNLEIFDEYMEQYRQPRVPLKNPLFQPKRSEK